MMEVAVAQKTKIILVGGMEYNVPDDLKIHFDIVKHITGSKYNTLPQAEYIFVFTSWANHQIVEQVKGEAKIPIIWLPQGWAAMKETLLKRSLLPPDAPEAPAAPVAPSNTSAPSTLGLSEAEIWKKFGDKMMEACRTILEIGQKVTEKELLDILAMAGPPPEDCKLFLPKLQMLGIVAPTKGDLWRLASSDSEAYEAEAPEGAEMELAKRRKRVEIDLERTDAEDRLRMIPGNPSLAARLLAGLPPGPYPTKRSIYVAMRKYKEFAGLTDNQVRSALERAIEQKIVDDTHKELIINHQYDLKLTMIEKLVVEEEPAVPKVLPPPSILGPQPPPQVVVSDGLNQEEAQKKWCFVIERVQQIRQRVGDILQHCRIEWMGTNKVLVIFIPPVLANCQKFLESMENWGSIHRTVQEHYTKDTVIRFMLDNGLRG